MNIPSVLLAIALSIFLLMAPRRYFLFPFIMAACFVPMNQRLIIIDLDWTLLRILVLVGFLRLIVKRETRDIKWNSFDKLILAWVLVGSFVYMVQQANFSAVINRSGVMFDALGMYWLFRHAIQTWEDVFQAIKIVSIFAIITAPLIAMEKFHNSSFFSIFGPAGGMFQRGRFRAAGPFPHAIMMGCFWASLLPLLYARIKANKDNLLYLVAIGAALSNVYFSASSTPIMTVAAVILFWNIFNYRRHGKILFSGTCVALLTLHLIMKAPVWHLIARANVFGGSTGWHRYFLFDNFITHIQEWFIFGTKSTSHWGFGQSDLTNQFVLEGIRGGIVTFLIFSSIVFCAVRIPGKLSLNSNSPEVKWMSWGICVAMLSHFVTFWGVSYFGQINMLLYFMFAIVGFCLEKNRESLRKPLLFKAIWAFFNEKYSNTDKLRRIE